MKDVRALVKFMSQSSLAGEPFERAREHHKIGRGLETIGNTRFATTMWSADSVHHCIPAFREVVKDHGNEINIAVCHTIDHVY